MKKYIYSLLLIVLIVPCLVLFASCEKKEQECSHTAGDWIVIQAADCTTPGERVKKCTICGEIVERETISASHTYGDFEVTKEADCTHTGEKTHICEKCGHSETESIPTNDVHDFAGAYEQTVAPTCAVCGTEIQHCSRCDATRSREIPILTGDGVHVAGEWDVFQVPTCQSMGREKTTCTICNTIMYRDLQCDLTNHEWDDWIIRMTNDGASTRQHECKYCLCSVENPGPKGETSGRVTVEESFRLANNITIATNLGADCQLIVPSNVTFSVGNGVEFRVGSILIEALGIIENYGSIKSNSIVNNGVIKSYNGAEINSGKYSGSGVLDNITVLFGMNSLPPSAPVSFKKRR